MCGFIYLGEDDSGYICIPRGLLERLEENCGKAAIPYEIGDQRSQGTPVKASFTGELRENQIRAVSRMLEYDCGILSAATAFGKTVVCSNLIAQRKTSTLILLESSSLIEQWEKELNEFLDIEEELPTYQTPSGRIKTRKSLVGVIHGAKDTSTGIVDIAMVGSLCKKGEYHPRLRSYGMCIVDECHHAAADTMKNVLQEVNAHYVYGVTATPFRGDGLEKINEMLLGPIRFQFTAKEKAAEQGIMHVVVPRFTRVVSPYGRKKLHVNDAYEILRDSEVRNSQIAADIQGCVENGRTPVVLTKYTDHAVLLYERVMGHPDAYMYGRDEHRLELLDLLRNAGCIIHLARENCEHFVIIDGEIVWYGSMNLLSREDVEDNLMRVVSADIAAELMEMTFGKGRELIEIGQ